MLGPYAKSNQKPKGSVKFPEMGNYPAPTLAKKWPWFSGFACEEAHQKWKAHGMASLPLALQKALAALPCFVDEETEAKKHWEEPSSPACHNVSLQVILDSCSCSENTISQVYLGPTCQVGS